MPFPRACGPIKDKCKILPKNKTIYSPQKKFKKIKFSSWKQPEKERHMFFSAAIRISYLWENLKHSFSTLYSLEKAWLHISLTWEPYLENLNKCLNLKVYLLLTDCLFQTEVHADKFVLLPKIDIFISTRICVHINLSIFFFHFGDCI
jgi:hypothetical protein